MIGIVLTALALGLGAAAAVYFYHNTHYDSGFRERLRRAGFVEKQVELPDGTVLNYGEGPFGGPALLLIHGQTVSWKDYAPVLPGLSRRFHVYAVDCHGHGGSSMNPAKYTAQAIGWDFRWFLEHVVGERAYVSGHSSGGCLRHGSRPTRRRTCWARCWRTRRFSPPRRSETPPRLRGWTASKPFMAF